MSSFFNKISDNKHKKEGYTEFKNPPPRPDISNEVLEHIEKMKISQPPPPAPPSSPEKGGRFC